MPSELFEYKSSTLGNSDSINLDEAQGIVECFVAGIGNKDSVGDIVASGAFTKSLQRRKPRVVWGHSWNDPIGKVLEIYEVPNTDNRLPMKMKMAGIGGLFARVQFNLNSEKGREAFAMVAFFGEEQEWSIGYKTLRAQFDQKSQANVIYELELYEVSPVLHGANQLTGTISVKSEDSSSGVLMSMMNEEDPIDKAEIEKQLAAILGAKVSLMEVNDDEITFARRMDNGEVGRYKCGFSNSRGHYMFGAPRPIIVMPTRRPIAPASAMPMAMPGMPPNEPQRVVRPSQMPSIPVAIKPGENGNQIVPLPPVQYENDNGSRFDPSNLDQEEVDLRDALLKIVKRHGKFNEDSEGVWAAYTPAAQNEVAGIGVKCSNCVFYQGGSACKIIDMEVEPEGKCRFAVIPKGVVKGAGSKAYELDEEFAEEDYVADLEVKYPGELAVAGLRGAVGKRRKKRRSFKLLSEFGSKSENFEDKPYLLPVVPQFAFQVKQVLDPIFDYHGVDSYVDTSGIFMTSGVTYELIEAVDNAVANLKKKSLSENDVEWKAAGYRLGRAISSRLIDRPNIGGGRSRNRFFTSIGAEDFDPFTARDANLNGIVGEGLFLRGVPLAVTDPTPDGPGSIRNPKPSPRQVAKPNAAAISRAEIQVEKITKPKERQKLSSGSELVNLPRIDDPDVDSAEKYGAAESQRDELQGVLDGASDSDQIKKLKKAIAEVDKYMKRVEKMAEAEMEKEKTPSKPKATRRIPPDKDLVTSVMQQDQDRENATLSSGYGKYLSKPEAKRTQDERRKYDGVLSSLSSGKLADKAELPEGAPQLEELYKEMAKDIVAILQELANNPDASKKWEMPWRNAENYARNPTSNRIYQGMNQMILSLTGSARGYKMNRWAGEGQWKKLGGKVKPGSRNKGVQVLVPRQGRTFLDSTGKQVEMGRSYSVQTVYNVDEIAGLPKSFYELGDIEINQEQRLQDVENVIKEIGPSFVESLGSQAFYRPSTDKIHMPAFEQFKDALAFYGTAMHETIHWTSHPSRLDRKLGKTFGDEDYAFEELIAEIGSAFAMGAMGLEPAIREDHLLYLSSWIKKLQKDPLAIHRAILQAQKANDYVMDRSATMRKLAGIPDGERKGKDSGWFEIPMIAGYPGGEKIKSPTVISGPMEDLLDMEQYDKLVPDARNLSIEEREMRSFQIHPNAVRRNKDGVVITPSGALASGKKAGPIKSRKGAPDIERTDEDISMKWAFGLNDEPTNEQRDIMNVVMHLIREKNPQMLSILAGAGTGKTTTLKSIAWALAREFNLWPEDDERRIEQLKYLADRYKVDFGKMSPTEIALAVAKLAKDKPMGNMYYTVFNTIAQHEAEKEFPKNTGVSTTDKLFIWSLILGGGDERFGPAFRRKMAVQKLRADNLRAGGRKPNPKFISKEKTPDEPEKIGFDFIREHFDGTLETFVGEEPGYRTLGWQRLDDAVDWIKFLEIDKWPDQQTRRRDRVQRDAKGKPVIDAVTGKPVREQYDEPVFILPDGRGTVQVTREEMTDILSNALGRWDISKEEKAAAWMFTPPPIRLEARTTPGGQGRDIHVVDTVLTEDQVPKLWVEALQQAIDAMMDGNSNMIPRRNSVQKLWLLSNPDLRTDPGLITHSENQTRSKVPIPNTYKVGDKYVDGDGEEWIVTNTSSDGTSSKVKANLARRVATAENPLSAFMVDEAQDSNEILETVLENNRKNLPIILVGDDRQAIYAFRNAKNILSSLDAEYELSITESFRYGPVVAHLTNMALGKQNLYLRGQEVPQSVDWKHVKGQAQDVITMLFDPVLAKKDRKGLNQVPEINDKTRALFIADIERRFSTRDKKIEISGKARVVQDAILRELRDKLYDEREGKIVDFVELANQGIFPDAILTGTNAEIIDWALKFISIVINRPDAEKDENGMPKIPEVVIPTKKHEDLLAFTIQLDYIMKSPEQQAAYEKIFGGRPPESGWLGPVWTQGRLQQLLKQSRSQQLTTAHRLIMTAPPGQAPLGTRGMLTLLRGENITEEVNGKQKVRVIPAVILPERKTQQLDNFTGDDSDPTKGVRGTVLKVSRGNKVASEQANDNQLEKITIIPPPKGTTDSRGAVYAQLDIVGGSEKQPGKPTGKIIITGDGVDSNRPKTDANGAESRNNAPNNRIGNGRYRRNLEKIIQRLGLQDKVKTMEGAEDLRSMRKGAKRRQFDGWIIEGETLQESSDILELLGQALRDEAKKVGGDVRITTMALSKGQEYDYMVMADDIPDPDDNLPQSTPKGEFSIGWMEGTNLVHVAFSRAKKMIDPGAKGFAFYLHDQKTKPVREAMAQAVKDGHIPEGLDRGAFSDEGGIPLPDFFKKLNDMPVENIDFDNLPSRGGAKPDPSTSLSSGADSGPKNTPTRRDDRLTRRGSSGGSRIYDGSGSAQEIAGIRFRGNLKSPKEQAKLNFSMNVWKRFRDVGIAIDVDDDASETEARKSKNAATIKSVGAEMKKRQNLVRVGRVGDNNVNDTPSALTWMLSVDKLAETLRVPTEFVSANRNGKSELQWTQTRPVTRKELATLLGLNGPDTAALEAPDAGINHDAVRLLIAELGKQPELSAWRYFSPVSAEEVAKIIPPSPSGAVEEFSKIDLAMENVGRANMRDRFIIETFGKDAFPHWFDPEEGESITPDEYSKLGEISAVSKFRATGRFDPEDPTKGDSEAEYDLYGELIDGVLPSAEPDGELISGDKTSREDFELEQLLKYLGIDRQEWKTTLKERMSAAFGMDAVGAWDEWKKDGIPTATVAHMIRTGLIPDAASVWKDASTGERFDNELKKSKYAVYEALNEFIDKSFPDSKLNSQASRNKITGKTDMGVALRDAATAKGSAWSPKKGNEARFSESELQSIVDRFNEVFGTNHTIDDIFSAEQLRTAAERIESGETLSGKKRTVS